ncbi:hypothetical protein [Ramlibacter humi]|uniref:Uncharacterized protein n=1 Tax=Ramlibacter humi TaxID=2530451 RepID=A0A4Z0C9N6_9BURK|nr:hypothetical protein [Ramlibacter humi]TFZ08387.1 hypothetical protein EZ216_04320 [Ramlibacter humi]
MALAAVLAAVPAQADEHYGNSAAAKAAMEQLRTDAPAEVRARWGAFADLAGGAFIAQDVGSYEVMWRDLEWLVPGAVMRWGNGMCRSGECYHADYVVQWNPQEKRLDFFYENSLKMTAQPRADGALPIRYGFMGFETVLPEQGLYRTERYSLEPATQSRLLAMSKGKAGSAQRAAQEAAGGQGTAAAAAVPSGPAVESAMKATGQSAAELSRRWGLLLGVLDKRFMDVDGRDVAWRAFEWQQPGVAMRQWVVGCGNFGCGSPYQVIIRPTDTEGLLEVNDTVDGSRRYFAVEPDGALRLQSTRTGVVLGKWRLGASGQLSMHGRWFRPVDADTLAQATQGKSKAVALAADNPPPRPAAVAPVPAPAPAAAAPAGGSDLKSQLAAMQQQMAALAKKIEEQDKAARTPAAASTPARAPSAATRQSAPAPARAAGQGAACGAVEGVYGTGDNYQVQVSFEGDTLVLQEPNRRSVYRHEGNCQFAFTHPNGTTYRLGVSGKSLNAYKGDPSSGTALGLLRAAPAAEAARVAAPASGSCKAEAISFQNAEAANPNRVDHLYGIRSLPDRSAEPSGRYQAPEPNGRPWTVLGPNGVGGTFEEYGAPRPDFIYGIRRWWIQANCDGSPVVEKGAAGSRYLLIYELDRPRQGSSWQRDELIVLEREDKMFFIDRVKSKR